MNSYRIKNFTLILTIGLIYLKFVLMVHADVTASRPDGHAPIGVMGEHTHHEGDWMLSYRIMNMFMSGHRSGTNRVSNQQVLSQFMVAPTRMKMEMHMLGLMYSPGHKVTFMGMVPLVRKSMDHVNRMGRTFNTETNGFGDSKLSALIILCRSAKQQIHFNTGVSFPTGSIDERDDTLMPDQLLPYPMQLGSGTFDVIPGVTYIGQTTHWSWGAQSLYEWRLGENSRNYTLGDKLKASVWGARKINSWISSSVRFAGESWGDIDGRDKNLNALMVPTADPSRRAGDRIDFLCGFNVYAPEGKLKGHRVAFEFGWPVYQRLDGPQLETDYLATVGWQKSY